MKMATESEKVHPSLAIHAQYIKDLSFENPNHVAAFSNENNAQPNISVNIQAKAENIGGRNFEVVLDIRIDAAREQTSLFVAELSYAGIVSLGESVTEHDAGALLMVDSP